MKLGIDFGTCYSSAALFIDGKLFPVKEPSKPLEYCFPSSVCVTKKGEIVISQTAENQRRLNPQGYKNQFKRDLETGIPFELGGKSLFPEDLVEIMIQGLKKEAEKIVNSSLNSVVITTPATYLSSKKQLMETAAKKAGFTEVTLLAEPVAAAIYYAEVGKVGHQLNEGDIILVYDLGGGTFDAALIQKKGHSYELLCQPEGDEKCGGIDFDRLIGRDFIQQLEHDDPGFELLTSKGTDNDVLRAKLSFQDWCRNFKHQLSMVEEYEDLSPVGSDSYSLSREQFEGMIAQYIDSSCNLCQRLVEKAGIKWEGINRILLVGGSSRIPYVQKRLEEKFQRLVVTIDDPELAICYGAAIYGVNLIKVQEAEQKRNVRKFFPIAIFNYLK
jgi:molecular chaperone DnaK (HSP70)